MTASARASAVRRSWPRLSWSAARRSRRAARCVRGDEVRAVVDEPAVRVLPRDPVVGQSPEEVVSGFLEASASFEVDHEVARRFLSPSAAESWNADAGVTVIDDNPELPAASEFAVGFGSSLAKSHGSAPTGRTCRVESVAIDAGRSSLIASVTRGASPIYRLG